MDETNQSINTSIYSDSNNNNLISKCHSNPVNLKGSLSFFFKTDKSINEPIKEDEQPQPPLLPSQPAAEFLPIIQKPKLISYESLSLNTEHPVKVISYLTPSNIWLRLVSREKINQDLSIDINRFYSDDPNRYLTESGFSEIKIGIKLIFFSHKFSKKKYIIFLLRLGCGLFH